MGNLVKSVTLQITGEIRDAAAKVGLITRDVQALADKSPVELKAELTGSEEVRAKLTEIGARAERLKKEIPELTAKLAILRAEIRKTCDAAGGAGRSGLAKMALGLGSVGASALSAVAPLATS